MALSSIGQQFQVNQVDYSADFPVRLNIKKRREKVFYRTISNRDNINIEHLSAEPINPENNLYISDRGTSLTQNRIPSVIDVFTDTTNSITLNVEKFLVTDVFSTETPTQPSVPLFYLHALSFFNEDVEDFEDKTLLAVEFADKDLRPVRITDYLLESTTGKIYNNVENSYNSSTGTADITFVKYTVKTDTAFGPDFSIYRELINNSPVFSQATIDDVDEFGNLLTDRKKYILSEVGGQEYEIVLPANTKYGYKEAPESRIRILPPTATDLSTPDQ